MKKSILCLFLAVQLPAFGAEAPSLQLPPEMSEALKGAGIVLSPEDIQKTLAQLGLDPGILEDKPGQPQNPGVPSLVTQWLCRENTSGTPPDITISPELLPELSLATVLGGLNTPGNTTPLDTQWTATVSRTEKGQWCLKTLFIGKNYVNSAAQRMAERDSRLGGLAIVSLISMFIGIRIGRRHVARSKDSPRQRVADTLDSIHADALRRSPAGTAVAASTEAGPTGPLRTDSSAPVEDTPTKEAGVPR